jgi:hypothetical protein
MSPTPRSRDRFRLGVSTLTALVSAASITAVGWFAGTAAREQQAKQARDDAAQATAAAKAARARAIYDAAVAAQKSAALPRPVILRPRPQRTVVHTQYVSAATTPVVVGGGTVSSSSSSPAAPPPVVHQAAPVYHAPPPPPPPPPAPTSGSHHG